MLLSYFRETVQHSASLMSTNPSPKPRIRKEARLLLQRASDSLLLAVEHFNRPWDRGRPETVLILLDHSFEMLLKAVILHRGGRIREPRAKQTIGFDACVRKGLSDAAIQFIANEQAVTLQMINALRDAAQHHILQISEPMLYLHTQAGLTLFSDLLKTVFAQSLADTMPERVLPVSTKPPATLENMIEHEVEVIAGLLMPGRRKKMEARFRIRALAIMDGAIKVETILPRTGHLNSVIARIAHGEAWQSIFPGIAALELNTSGEGIPFHLRITKKEGVPVHLVPEGTPGATVIAIKRVDELGFYSLGLSQLAEKVELTSPRTWR